MENSYSKSVMLSPDGGSVVILDQTLLPNEIKYLELKTEYEVWEAISSLRVRGAPAIGIVSAFGIYVLTKDMTYDFFDEFKRIKKYLSTSRPTAINLSWALERMERCLDDNKDEDIGSIKEKLRIEAEAIRMEDEETCRLIGEYALSLLKPGMGILTHCNAGRLATAGDGTALSPIYLGNSRGYSFRVYAGETRPLLQGARLTVWELMQGSVDVTLICDSAASSLMKKGSVDAVIVGCDRVAMNGDTANKTGTSALAILAAAYDIPFYVCCPTSTLDPDAETGADITIEERDGKEIYEQWFKAPMAPEGVKTYNPAFDITDSKYITAIITEKGIIYPPYD
jgi:methylthioribose-1-phosphate isomerase